MIELVLVLLTIAAVSGVINYLKHHKDEEEKYVWVGKGPTPIIQN